MKAWKWMFPLLLTPQFMIAAAVSIYATIPGAAQTITNGGLTGVMVTRAAKVGASTTITFLTVPANRYFILTQACYTIAAGTNLRLNGVGGAQGNQGNTSASRKRRSTTPTVSNLPRDWSTSLGMPWHFGITARPYSECISMGC